MADDPDCLITTEELAERWRTTPNGVHCMRYRGEAPPAIRVGRRVLWRLSDVTEWERKRTTTSSDRQVA